VTSSVARRLVPLAPGESTSPTGGGVLVAVVPTAATLPLALASRQAYAGSALIREREASQESLVAAATHVAALVDIAG